VTYTKPIFSASKTVYVTIRNLHACLNLAEGSFSQVLQNISSA